MILRGFRRALTGINWRVNVRCVSVSRVQAAAQWAGYAPSSTIQDTSVNQRHLKITVARQFLNRLDTLSLRLLQHILLTIGVSVSGAVGDKAWLPGLVRRREVPDLHRLVPAAADNPLAVRAETHACDPM